MNFPALALAALVLTSAARHPQPASMVVENTTTAQLTIENYAFRAPTVTVAVGTHVVWKNLDDDPHTVTATDGSFDSKGLAQGDTFTRRFTKPGTYRYYCKVHPMMRGTIIVKESGS